MNIERITQKVFAELGREKQLVEYHDIIFKLLGVVIDFINANGESLKLSKMKHFNPFCEKLRNSGAGAAACQQCDCDNARSAALSQRELIYRCYAGLTEVVVPLFDNHMAYIGSMTTGQFRRTDEENEDPQAIDELARQCELPAEELLADYRQSIRLSDSQIEGLILFLKTIGQMIERTHNRLAFLEMIDSSNKLTLIKQFVEENYMEPLSIEKVAKRFYLSPGYFSHFFQKATGISFMNYVNMFRVSRAEELLKSTSLSITEIAFLVGFGSVSQFNRTFKNVTSCSPRAFRHRTTVS